MRLAVCMGSGRKGQMRKANAPAEGSGLIKYVYVSGPYTHPDPVENVRGAILAADALRSLGFVPFVPHLTMLWHMVAPHPLEFWYRWDMEWVKKCDAVLRLPGLSKGADAEVMLARELALPVAYTIEELVWWSLQIDAPPAAAPPSQTDFSRYGGTAPVQPESSLSEKPLADWKTGRAFPSSAPAESD